jgi:DNA-binding MarR family transcriptional regulator
MPLATSHAHALVVMLEHARKHAQITQQQLGFALGIDKSNVTRLCAKMERAGHLAQSRSPTDGRARVLTLTTKGYRLAERAETSSRARFAQLMAAVPARARTDVLDSLEALTRAVRSIRAVEASS